MDARDWAFWQAKADQVLARRQLRMIQALRHAWTSESEQASEMRRLLAQSMDPEQWQEYLKLEQREQEKECERGLEKLKALQRRGMNQSLLGTPLKG